MESTSDGAESGSRSTNGASVQKHQKPDPTDQKRNGWLFFCFQNNGDVGRTRWKERGLEGEATMESTENNRKTKTQRQWEERKNRKLLTKKCELSKTMRRPFVEIEKKPFSGPVPPTTSSVELEQAPYFCRASSLLSYFRLSLSFLSVGELIKSASFPTLR